VIDTLTNELDVAKPSSKGRVTGATARSLGIAIVEYAEEYLRSGEEEEGEAVTWPDGSEMAKKLVFFKAAMKELEIGTVEQRPDGTYYPVKPDGFALDDFYFTELEAWEWLRTEAGYSPLVEGPSLKERSNKRHP